MCMFIKLKKKKEVTLSALRHNKTNCYWNRVTHFDLSAVHTDFREGHTITHAAQPQQSKYFIKQSMQHLSQLSGYHSSHGVLLN